MWQFTEPFVEVTNHRGALREEGKVPRMDQEIAIWDGEFPMKLVRVANANYSHSDPLSGNPARTKNIRATKRK
jgi:hypothetical protein